MNTPLLHYQRHGHNHTTPIVLLHGFLGGGVDWHPIINRLAADFDFLVIDLPGHGRSNSIGLDFSFDDTADSIISILNKEKIPACPLLGYSMGGRIALFTATKYPDRFSQLMLESSSPGIQNPEQRKMRLDFEQRIIKNLEQLSMPKFIQDWYNMRLFDSIRNHPNFAKLVSSRIQNDRAALIHVIKNLGSGAMPSLWNELAVLDVPIHFIYGEKDDKYKSIATGIQEHGKNVSIYKIKNSGHNTHFENPQEFCTVLKKILTNEE